MNGWIKIHRKILDWGWYDDSNMVHLFVDLLLNANSLDGIWRGLHIPKGSLATSLDKLSERTGISIRTIRTCLKRLEDGGEIVQKSTNKYRVITVTNYATYQVAPTSKRQTNDKQTTNKRQTTDNKQEYKEEKNIRNKDNITPNGVVELWNSTCVNLPKIERLTEGRKNKIKTRLPEFGKTPEEQQATMTDVFRKAHESQFLNGNNGTGWRATFDWVFENDKNWVKIHEGQYDNKKTNNHGRSKTGNFTDRGSFGGDDK